MEERKENTRENRARTLERSTTQKWFSPQFTPSRVIGARRKIQPAEAVPFYSWSGPQHATPTAKVATSPRTMVSCGKLCSSPRRRTRLLSTSGRLPVPASPLQLSPVKFQSMPAGQSAGVTPVVMSSERKPCYTPRRRERLLSTSGRLPGPASPLKSSPLQTLLASPLRMSPRLAQTGQDSMATQHSSHRPGRCTSPVPYVSRLFAALLLLGLVMGTAFCTASLTHALSFEVPFPPANLCEHDVPPARVATVQHASTEPVYQSLPVPTEACRWKWRSLRCTPVDLCTARLKFGWRAWRSISCEKRVLPY